MKYPIKCNTVNQFKLLKWFDSEFELAEVLLEIVNENSIRLTDKEGKSSIFSTDGRFVNIDGEEITTL